MLANWVPRALLLAGLGCLTTSALLAGHYTTFWLFVAVDALAIGTTREKS